MVVLYMLFMLLSVIGFFAYNGLRRKYAGIIGVPGSYLVVLTIMLFVGMIAGLFGLGSDASGMEMVMTIVIMLLGIAYTAYVIVAKCPTVPMKVMLPIAAFMIGCGFVWRLLGAIVLHIPMESGEPEAEPLFPANMKDSNGDIWDLRWNNDVVSQYYCSRTGETREFHSSDFANGKPFGYQ